MGDLVFQQLTVAVGLTDSPFLSANPKRVGLVISSPPTNRITLSFQGPAVLDAGINLYPGNSPFHLGLLSGDAAFTGDIRAISAVAGQSIGVIEIFRR